MVSFNSPSTATLHVLNLQKPFRSTSSPYRSNTFYNSSSKHNRASSSLLRVLCETTLAPGVVSCSHGPFLFQTEHSSRQEPRGQLSVHLPYFLCSYRLLYTGCPGNISRGEAWTSFPTLQEQPSFHVEISTTAFKTKRKSEE